MRMEGVAKQSLQFPTNSVSQSHILCQNSSCEVIIILLSSSNVRHNALTQEADPVVDGPPRDLC